MSLAAFKRKSQVLYNNMSVNRNGFSLNGGHRNQSYIGQSTQSRYLTRTLMKGPTIRGSGGCCGTYTVQNVVPSELACLNDPQVVKTSSMNTGGMLHSRYRWFYGGSGGTVKTVKQDSSSHTKKLGKCAITESDAASADAHVSAEPADFDSCSSVNMPALARPRRNGTVLQTKAATTCNITKPELHHAMPYSEYLNKLDVACTANDPEPIDRSCACVLPGPSRSR